MARRIVARSALALLLAMAAALGCEAIAGYNDVEAWGLEAGASRTDSEPRRDTAVPPNDSTSIDQAAPTSDAKDAQVTSDAPADVTIDQAPIDQDAGPCPILTGNNACEKVPRFTKATQIVDGIGDEFCDIPAMVFDVSSCPTLYPAEPPTLPEKVYLRIAWSDDAFHLHVKVVDPNVIVNSNDNALYSGDAVEIFLAGTSGEGLSGSYNGFNDGGAIQIVLAPPAGGFPTRGRAFFNPGGGVHTNAPITASTFAGRLVADGYELELRYVWVVFADPVAAGRRIAFDLAVDAQQSVEAGGRQVQCIIENNFVDGQSACGYSRGTPAQPWCDDRTWCQPQLQP